MVNVAIVTAGLLCLVGCFAVPGPKAADDVRLHVVLNMYSGKPDPCWSWTVPRAMYDRLGLEVHRVHNMKLGQTLGYRGFTVYKFLADGSGIEYRMELPKCMARGLEGELLASAPPCRAADMAKCRLKTSSRQYIENEIQKPCN